MVMCHCQLGKTDGAKLASGMPRAAGQLLPLEVDAVLVSAEHLQPAVGVAFGVGGPVVGDVELLPRPPPVVGRGLASMPKHIAIGTAENLQGAVGVAGQ